jgi:ABC-type amino acid transport substrate-binding protein
MVSFEIKVDESKLLEVTEALKKYDVKFDKSIIECLKYDPYYFERKKELEQLLKDIENGKEPLIEWEEAEKEIDKWLEKLKNENS